MAATAQSVADLCRSAKRATRALAALRTTDKDAALLALADALEARTTEIVEANARDLEAGRESGLSAALMDRLALDAGRVRGLKSSQVREILPRATDEAVHRDYFVLA